MNKVSSRLALIAFLVTIVMLLAATLACGGQALPTATLSLDRQIYSGAFSLSPTLEWGTTSQVSKLDIAPITYTLETKYILSRSIVTPAPGAAFLWVEVNIANTGDNAQNILYSYKLYYRGKIIYEQGTDRPVGHERFPLYNLYPGVSQLGWVLFEVPQHIIISDTYFLISSTGSTYVAWNFPLK